MFLSFANTTENAPFLFLFLRGEWGGRWFKWLRDQLASIFGGSFFITKCEQTGVITTYKILNLVVTSARVATNGLK